MKGILFLLALFIGAAQAQYTPPHGVFTTINASGISRLDGGVGVGIDPTSANPVNFSGTSNGSLGATFLNSSTGTGAYSAITMSSSGGSGSLVVFGGSYTTSGLFVQDSMRVASGPNLSGGMYLATLAAAPVVFGVNNVEVGRFSSTGAFIIPTSTPASASATGTAGTIAWDANFIYICTATNTWKRVAISTW